MSRLAERNARKTSSVTSGSRQSRQTGVEVRAGGRTSTHTGRRDLDAADANSSYGMTSERHDWLVPLELP
jgi:hypothetical protein